MAPVNVAPHRLAPVRSAPLISASVRSALRRFAPRRSLLARIEWLRSALLRSAERKSDAGNFADEKRLPLRSALVNSVAWVGFCRVPALVAPAKSACDRCAPEKFAR